MHRASTTRDSPCTIDVMLPTSEQGLVSDADGRRPARLVRRSPFPRFPGTPASHTQLSTQTDPDADHGGSYRALSATQREIHSDGFADRFRACMQALAAKLGLTPLLNKARTGGAYPALDDRSGKLTRAGSGDLRRCARRKRVLPPAPVLSPVTDLLPLPRQPSRGAVPRT